MIDRAFVAFFWAYWGGLWLMVFYVAAVMLCGIAFGIPTSPHLPRKCPQYWQCEIHIDDSGKVIYGRHLCEVHYPEEYGKQTNERETK